ncbi:hypothetical protein J5X84_44065 [Streptosporangiaceae bacterium NEAU-GS5]|nr:hypothetical protein [Streptosporangiaceae bacterium NEAU-GS5]
MGLDPGRWTIRGGCKTILVVVHTVTSGRRLLDVVDVLKSDQRVQVVFTQAPGAAGSEVAGLTGLLGGLPAVCLPWQRAVRTRFDLALAAGWQDVREIQAPLVVLPHGAEVSGAGFKGLAAVPPYPPGRRVRAVPPAQHGLDVQRVLSDGALAPSTLALPHLADREQLAQWCPEALPVTRVVGDPCHDLLLASLPYRSSYRRALQVAPGQKLVVVSSAHGPHSLFARRSDLLYRLVSDLPSDEYRVVALLHPNVWFRHGIWQIRAWLGPAMRRGLTVLPLEEDWRSVLTAADWIVGDRGPATVYGAVTGAPVLLTRSPSRHVAPGSAMAELMAVAPRVRRRVPLLHQLEQARSDYDPARYQRVSARITSAPGQFDRNMRRLLYRLLRLRQPTVAAATTPVAVPILAPINPPSI